VRAAIEGVQRALPSGAWASWVLGNHDNPRFASSHRAGRDQAKVGLLLLLSLRGTPTFYYGEEIGMVDVPVAPDDARDPLGRDPERTPMQWDATPNAGFTSPDARPWLPVAADADRVNVAAQAEDPDSLLTLTHRLLQLRREHPVLHVGDFEPFGPSPVGTYAFRRVSPSGRLTVLLNLTDTRRRVTRVGSGRVLIGSDRNRDTAVVGDVVELGPNEALIVEAP
jgi:alpha-glucosidase